MIVLRAATLYAALAFAAGFVLGAARVLLLAPVVGAVPAVLIETPVMLAISWIACAWTMRRLAVPERPSARLGVGVAAFAVLQVLEAGLGIALGRTMSEVLAGYATPEGRIGLAAQAAFALLPFLHAQLVRRARASAA